MTSHLTISGGAEDNRSSLVFSFVLDFFNASLPHVLLTGLPVNKMPIDESCLTTQLRT